MTHENHVEERYFAWLCQEVGIGWDDEPPTTLVVVARQFHSTPFVWFEHIPRDVNRVQDALELRSIFAYDNRQLDFSSDFWDLPASLFEVLVALTERCAGQTGRDRNDWFLRFLVNLGVIGSLSRINSKRFPGYLDDVARTLMERRYQANGVGGLFPLRNPYEDQRTIEIWEQMSAYIIEEMEAIGFLASD